MPRTASSRAREPSRLIRAPFSKSSSASPETTAARWNMTSGRASTSAVNAAASLISAAMLSTAPPKFSGFGGALTSTSVSLSTGRPLSAPSRASCAVSFRPIMPPAPVIRMCIFSPRLRYFRGATKWRARNDELHRHTAVDEMRLTGNVASFVASEKQRKGGDFLRGAEPPHRLAIDESLPYFIERPAGFLRCGGDAVFQRRRFDRAGTNGVAADALLDEIGCDRLRQPDHRRLGGAVGIAVRNAADR